MTARSTAPTPPDLAAALNRRITRPAADAATFLRVNDPPPALNEAIDSNIGAYASDSTFALKRRIARPTADADAFLNVNSILSGELNTTSNADGDDDGEYPPLGKSSMDDTFVDSPSSASSLGADLFERRRGLGGGNDRDDIGGGNSDRTEEKAASFFSSNFRSRFPHRSMRSGRGNDLC